MQIQRKFSIFFLAFFLYISGCSFDYEDSSFKDDLKDSVPQTIITVFSEKKIVDNLPQRVIRAKQAETYTKLKKTVLKDITITQYDKEGNIRFEGKADSMIFFTDSENAILSGNIKIHITDEDATIKGAYFDWNQEQDTLISDPNKQVTIESGSGTYISGYGFSSNLKTKTIVFSHKVQGEIRDEEDN